ncbi:MAG: hypothetical protein [Circoviridae sp.]|nr:MAG: hypothetical protein [Circoviridae sp.]
MKLFLDHIILQCRMALRCDLKIALFKFNLLVLYNKTLIYLRFFNSTIFHLSILISVTSGGLLANTTTCGRLYLTIELSYLEEKKHPFLHSSIPLILMLSCTRGMSITMRSGPSPCLAQ